MYMFTDSTRSVVTAYTYCLYTCVNSAISRTYSLLSVEMKRYNNNNNNNNNNNTGEVYVQLEIQCSYYTVVKSAV